MRIQEVKITDTLDSGSGSTTLLSLNDSCYFVPRISTLNEEAHRFLLQGERTVCALPAVFSLCVAGQLACPSDGRYTR
jgi:hypothetical protein